MKIIRARVRGLGDTIETEWFELSPRLNLFHILEEKSRISFLTDLASLNPLLPCEVTKPFAEFPLVSRRQGHSRRIHPGKRTVALAIFNSTPDMVAELAAASPHLYEADRIEVGRRLDYSRWINFVEISSSTRWREIASDFGQLASRTKEISPEKAVSVESVIRSLHGSDRVKGGIDRDLQGWLRSLPAEVREDSQQRIDQLCRAVHRAEDFQTARRIVERRLPIFVVLSGASPHQEPVETILQRIDERLEDLGGPPAAAARDFLKALNEQLEIRQFADLRLHLELRAGSGVFLSAEPSLATIAPDSSLMHLQAAIALAIAFCRVTCRTEPILIFDCPERRLPPSLHRQLSDFILTTAEFCQCLYGYAELNIFSRHRGLPKFLITDLTKPGH